MSIQNSDADLKAAQLPVVNLGSNYIPPGINWVGIRVKAGATFYNQAASDFGTAGALDLSAVTTLQGSTDQAGGMNATVIIASTSDLAKYAVPLLTNLIGGASTGNLINLGTGGNALLKASGLAVDPALPLTTITGGLGNYNGTSWGTGGNAMLDLSGNNFTSAVCSVQSMLLQGLGTGPGYYGNATLSYANCPNLTTLDLSALGGTEGSLQVYDATVEINVSNCPSLTSVAMPSGGVNVTADSDNDAAYLTFDFNGCALTAGAINVILAALQKVNPNSINLNGATLDISGGTNAVPDSTGAAYIATMTGNGWTVYYNT